MSTEMLSFRLRLIFNVSAGEKVENDTDDCTLFTSKQEIIELAFISTMPSFTKGRILEMRLRVSVQTGLKTRKNTK
jgi:hypothetical protein